MKELKNTIGLSIETSGRVGSVCVSRGPAVLEEARLSGKMRHSSELMPAVRELLTRHKLKATDVEYFYFPVGPGSFTGLRIAVTMAKMISFALPVGLVAVNSLDVIAENTTEYAEQTGRPVRRAAAILDAKRDLFYASVYRLGAAGWEVVEGNLLISADELIGRFADSSEEPLHVLGEGLHYYRGKFAHENVTVLPEAFWPACARNVLKVGYRKAAAGELTDPNTLTPLYIRRPEAVEKWESRFQK